MATQRSLTALMLAAAALVFSVYACGKSDAAIEPIDPDIPLPPPPPTIGLSVTTVSVTDTIGTPPPAALAIAVTSTVAGSAALTGITTGTITYGAGASGWLAAALSGAAAPATLTLTLSNAGLAAGTYTATVPVTASAATNSPQSVSVTFTIAPAPVPPVTGIVIMAAGNMGDCGGGLQAASAALVAAENPGYLFVLGDNARPRSGTVTSLQDYQDCFEPVWGRFKGITYAALGDLETDGDTLSPTAGVALGADAYFGAARVGDSGKNYYSFDIGTGSAAWHVVVLNVQSGGPRRPKNIQYRAGSAQLNWLWSDLGRNPKKCTLAIWHDPLWISSSDPPTPSDPYPNHGYRDQPVRGVWTVLYQRNADVVINGGRHIYERFAPMRYAEGYTNPTPSEFALDSARGIRQFSAGLAGNGPLSTPSVTIRHPLSEVRSGGNGMLKLTLGDGVYSWEFVNTASSHIVDSGRGVCH